MANGGGGTVEIGAGRFMLRNALHLRTNVHIVGVPGKTVFAIGSGRKAALASDVAKGATEITLVDAARRTVTFEEVADLIGAAFRTWPGAWQAGHDQLDLRTLTAPTEARFRDDAWTWRR